MITVRQYQKKDEKTWNAFVAHAKNGLFLFNRNYMEYHSDRFTDHSLLFFEKGTLRALLPANIHESILHSHEGLTFGGMITDTSMTAKRTLETFDTLIAYAKTHTITSITYRAIPYIYHQLPAQEDLYALFRHHARLVGRDIASVIDREHPLPFNDNTKRLLKQSGRLRVRETRDFNIFMDIVSSLLSQKYHAKPTHSAAEITGLAAKFPDNIRLFGCYRATTMIAGVMIYEYPAVAHCQYIAASDEGKRVGALSHIFHELLTRAFTRKRYFSFGKSTERLGSYLNEGLILNKEHYGGRGVVHDTYELPVG